MKFLIFSLIFICLAGLSVSINRIEQESQDKMKMREVRQSDIFQWGSLVKYNELPRRTTGHSPEAFTLGLRGLSSNTHLPTFLLAKRTTSHHSDSKKELSKIYKNKKQCVILSAMGLRQSLGRLEWRLSPSFQPLDNLKELVDDYTKKIFK
ncbi:hypothetical protein BpHYR1_022588 [Brachionus plicatilis]|uniref:Uncharacterized protein n=1 Tax=Brachionus plicatilis TaxID=10195 RepID=A0A3M7T7F8_BRAPC|nr:hypothetical protein BpHYR1_022588 [Brachionus plicatilis]